MTTSALSLFEPPDQAPPPAPADGAPEVVYASDAATVYLGRAEDVLAETATESVDLVLTDPPYGQDWRSNHRAEKFDRIEGDTAADRPAIRAVLTECVRVVGQNRHLYVFGPSDVLEGLKVSAPTSLVWDKGTLGSGDLSAPWGPQHEPISFVVSKFRHGGKAGTDSLAARLRKGSIIRATRPTGRQVRHPSEKPLALLRELVESSSRVGELVLDPYAGVGSTGVAAVLLGRRCVIVERDPRYVAVAVERIRAAERVAQEAAGL